MRSGAVELIETESRIVVIRGWEEGEVGSCSMGIESQFCKMKKF